MFSWNKSSPQSLRHNHYRCNGFILEDRNIQSTIPYRRNRKDIKEIDKGSYKERNIIERFFLRIKKFRRIATRFEKNADNFMNIVLIGCVCLMIGI